MSDDPGTLVPGHLTNKNLNLSRSRFQSPVAAEVTRLRWQGF